MTAKYQSQTRQYIGTKQKETLNIIPKLGKPYSESTYTHLNIHSHVTQVLLVHKKHWQLMHIWQLNQ